MQLFYIASLFVSTSLAQAAACQSGEAMVALDYSATDEGTVQKVKTIIDGCATKTFALVQAERAASHLANTTDDFQATSAKDLLANYTEPTHPAFAGICFDIQTFTLPEHVEFLLQGVAGTGRVALLISRDQWKALGRSINQHAKLLERIVVQVDSLEELRQLFYTANQFRPISRMTILMEEGEAAAKSFKTNLGVKTGYAKNDFYDGVYGMASFDI